MSPSLHLPACVCKGGYPLVRDGGNGSTFNPALERRHAQEGVRCTPCCLPIAAKTNNSTYVARYVPGGMRGLPCAPVPTCPLPLPIVSSDLPAFAQPPLSLFRSELEDQPGGHCGATETNKYLVPGNENRLIVTKGVTVRSDRGSTSLSANHKTKNRGRRTPYSIDLTATHPERGPLHHAN